MTDTVVQLGDFQFGRYEIPEQIAFGGEQALVVHRLVGGKRIVDAMGEDPAPLEWSGVFVGSNALDRALYLDGLRKTGRPLALTWSELSYTVVIRAFKCDFVRFYRLPYRITCEVVADLTSPITTIAAPSPEQLVDDDVAAAGDLTDEIADDTLTGLMADLSMAVSMLTGSAAPQSQVNTILTQIAAMQAQVSTLTQMASTISADANGSLPEQIAGFTGQVIAATKIPVLLNLRGTLGRMQTNIGSVNSGTRTVTQAGGNLYSLASVEYGDADGWTSIAAANGLSDPRIVGVTDLTIPPFVDTGGILGA